MFFINSETSVDSTGGNIQIGSGVALFFPPASAIDVPMFWHCSQFTPGTEPFRVLIEELLFHTYQTLAKIFYHLMTVDSVAVEGDGRMIPGY
jgi:hypothetical protein